ncbi:MAG: Holliday junction branch migration protein RuvA [Mycoplasma sp.]
MINYIYGKIIYVNKNYLILDCNGMGWKLKIFNEKDFIQAEFMKVYVHQVQKLDQKNYLISENYGFTNSLEKSIFIDLLGVHGIGCGIATNILNYGYQHFITAVMNEDYSTLSQIKGVSAKVASMIVINLRDKYNRILDKTDYAQNTHNLEKDQLNSALSQLGYDKNDIAIGMNQYESGKSLEEMIKTAMKVIALSHERTQL